MLLALDTEATGLDLMHGARPFLVTVCNQDGQNAWWEWFVDPKTRQVLANPNDLKEIQKAIDGADCLVLQNSRFDYRALSLLYQDHGLDLQWNWNKVDDTLLAGHLLASNHPHDLTSMVLEYLLVDIQSYESRMEQAVKAAKTTAKHVWPKATEGWRLARAGLPEMPSARSKAWKYDTWLPRLVAAKSGYLKNHPWWTVTADYANSDSASTAALWVKFKRSLEERSLWRLYRERLRVPPAIIGMEDAGVVINRHRLAEIGKQYAEEAEHCCQRCVNLSGGLVKKLPKGGTTKELKQVLFERFGLTSSKRTGKGNPSVDKYVLDEWIATLPRQSPAYSFVRNLRAYRRRTTALSYLNSYEKFWLPLDGKDRSEWMVLYPSINPTGTDTLRFSSSNPNEQQFSKQQITKLDEAEGGRSVRYVLGPAPNREWYSLDAENIELRIPAYEANERAMIDLFERPNDPPYYGSCHLLFFDILHPDLFAKYGRRVKQVYADTWYQWTKNGDFAVQYGAVAVSGTADRAYHVEGAQAKIESHLKATKQLGRRWITFAEANGYVETTPDKTVDPRRGYPLLCTRSNYGRILPTVPLSYHVQGTAMWWMMKAMTRCHAWLQEHNTRRKPEQQVHIIMQVHDELVFDFPKSQSRIAVGKDRGKPSNLLYVRQLQRLMERGGDDIDVPTPVGVTVHSDHWDDGVGL